MISEHIPKFLQAVTRIMRNSPQQDGLSSNYKTTAKKLSISLLIGAAMVAFGTSAAEAATFVSTNDGKIGKIDPTTGAFTQVASGSTAFTDIAISDTGKLFGINLSELYQVDLNTGAYSLIGFFGAANDKEMNALTFANKTLYGAKGDTIYSFNLQTGATTPVIRTPGFDSSGDLVFDAANNRLLATSRGGGNASDRLFSIDLTNFSYYIVGDSDIGFKDVFGLTFENGNLLGYTGDRKQISINTTTGKGTFLRDVTGTNSEIWGATYQADSNLPKSVPEPSTVLALLGVAAIGASSRLKRKKHPVL